MTEIGKGDFNFGIQTFKRRWDIDLKGNVVVFIVKN